MRVNLKAPESKKIKQDDIIEKLMNSTTEQINHWVDNNVNDLDDVKLVLKKIIRLSVFMLKKAN